jgi:predicted Na+-dependent transporter
VTVALLLLVAAPGGRFAPHIVKLAQGNLPLGVEITLFLAKLTGFTAAPTLKWMLTLKTLELRELPLIVQLLVLQIGPYAIGKWLRQKRRPLADSMMKPAYYLSIGAAVLTLLAVLFKGDRGVRELLSDRGWIAVGIVIVVFPILGWFAGGGRRANRKTFAIMSNARELALALVIASLAYPNGGVHTALFGIWSIMCVVTFGLSMILRSPKPASTAGEVRAGGPALGAPGAARSAPAR